MTGNAVAAADAGGTLSMGTASSAAVVAGIQANLRLLIGDLQPPPGFSWSRPTRATTERRNPPGETAARREEAPKPNGFRGLLQHLRWNY
jgi:hypothetical protein